MPSLVKEKLANQINLQSQDVFLERIPEKAYQEMLDVFSNEYHFKNGMNVGNHKEWYQDGSPLQDRNYANGQPMGSQKVWRRDGKIRANFVIRENGKKYGLMGMKRCTKIDTKKQTLEPYKGK